MTIDTTGFRRKRLRTPSEGRVRTMFRRWEEQPDLGLLAEEEDAAWWDKHPEYPREQVHVCRCPFCAPDHFPHGGRIDDAHRGLRFGDELEQRDRSSLVVEEHTGQPHWQIRTCWPMHHCQCGVTLCMEIVRP